MIDPSKYKIYYLSGDRLNGKIVELDGINNLIIKRQISFDNTFAIGGVENALGLDSPKQIEISFDRSYMQTDPLINFTGSNPILDFWIYNGDGFLSVSNSYLTSYSSAFSVGDLPKISTTFLSFGEDVRYNTSGPGYLYNGNLIKMSNDLDIPNINSISISGLYKNDGSQNNFKKNYNIFSFDYNLSINRQPFYSVGSLTPTEVSLILPIKMNSSINYKLPEKATDLNQIASSQPTLKIEFDIVVSGSKSIFKLPFRNGVLTDNEIKLSSQNTIDYKSNFEGLYGI